jgi:hypothetical protein
MVIGQEQNASVADKSRRLSYQHWQPLVAQRRRTPSVGNENAFSLLSVLDLPCEIPLPWLRLAEGVSVKQRNRKRFLVPAPDAKVIFEAYKTNRDYVIQSDRFNEPRGSIQNNTFFSPLDRDRCLKRRANSENGRRLLSENPT